MVQLLNMITTRRCKKMPTSALLILKRNSLPFAKPVQKPLGASPIISRKAGLVVSVLLSAVLEVILLAVRSTRAHRLPCIHLHPATLQRRLAWESQAHASRPRQVSHQPARPSRLPHRLILPLPLPMDKLLQPHHHILQLHPDSLLHRLTIALLHQALAPLLLLLVQLLRVTAQPVRLSAAVQVVNSPLHRLHRQNTPQLRLDGPLRARSHIHRLHPNLQARRRRLEDPRLLVTAQLLQHIIRRRLDNNTLRKEVLVLILYQHDLFENKPQNILIASEGFQELIGIFILVSILRLAFIAIRKDRVQYCCVCFKIALSTAVFSIC